MDKEELLRMASDAGLSYLDGASKNEYGHWIDDEIEAFANAILERAATVAESEPKVWDLDAPSPQDRIATKIRVLKNLK